MSGSTPQGGDGWTDEDRSWAAGDALLTQPISVQAVQEALPTPPPPRTPPAALMLAVAGALLVLWPVWEYVAIARGILTDGGQAQFLASLGVNLAAVVVGCVATVLLALGRTARGTLLLGIAVVGVVVAVLLDGGLLVATAQLPVLDALVAELGFVPGAGVTWWVVLADVSVALWAVATALLVSEPNRSPRHAPGA